MKIHEILEQINLENGSNYKMEVLELHKDNELLKQLLKMTYDKTISYGVSLKNLENFTPEENEFIGELPLEFSLASIMTNLSTRERTGHSAMQLLCNLIDFSSDENAEILKKLISRDLRLNIGRTNINKVFKKLITKPPYMRCSLMNKIDRIKYPARSDKKEDGTYRSLISDNGIDTMSRAGFLDDFTKFQEKVKSLDSGVYIGEFLIRSLPGSSNRMKANGLINSDTEQDDMYFVVWDYLTLEEFQEGKSLVPYEERRNTLKEKIEKLNVNCIEMVESRIVNSFEEAQEHYEELVSKGMEGTVLKNLDTPFKNHTSPEQIKMKEHAVSEFIVTGFQEGEGRLKGMLGSILYESSCGSVKGKASGFGDDIRKEIWLNQDKYQGMIVSIQYNGVTKAKGKDTYALMFASFEEFRVDKTEADDYCYIVNALK